MAKMQDMKPKKPVDIIVNEDFEAWLRTICFQKPTKEAYDLAKCAWEASKPNTSSPEQTGQRVTAEKQGHAPQKWGAFSIV